MKTDKQIRNRIVELAEEHTKIKDNIETLIGDEKNDDILETLTELLGHQEGRIESLEWVLMEEG